MGGETHVEPELRPRSFSGFCRLVRTPLKVRDTGYMQSTSRNKQRNIKTILSSEDVSGPHLIGWGIFGERFYSTPYQTC